MEVKALRVNERRVDEVSNRKRFESVIRSLYMRRSPKVTEADPHLTIPLANPTVPPRITWLSSFGMRHLAT